MKTQTIYQIENSKVNFYVEILQQLGIKTHKFIYVEREFWTNVYITVSEKKHELIEAVIENN